MIRPLLSVCLLLPFANTFSQPNAYKHPSTLGIHFILNDFKHSSIFGNLPDMDAGLSLNYLKGINPHFDYTIHFSASFPDSISKQSKSTEKSFFLQSDFAFRVRLLKKQNWINPYVQAGIGVATYRSNLSSYLLIGPGVEFNYKDVYFNTAFHYRPALSNNLNKHFFYSIGISGMIGKKTKKKVTTPPTIHSNTIIRDRDGDGIVDSIDLCPTVPGLAKYKGCPVPDRDKDGIADDEDRCPDIPGIVKYLGCPIPDTDGDGINDEKDSCLTVPGVKENNGCPLIRKELKEKIDLAAKNIFFKTGSYELLPQSYAALDEVVKILQEHPSLSLTIEGHTDNVGTIKSNQTLSENRASSVMKYLVSKHIDMNRLFAKGYGQSRPIDTNSSPEGRANNRRVELKLSN